MAKSAIALLALLSTALAVAPPPCPTSCDELPMAPVNGECQAASGNREDGAHGQAQNRQGTYWKDIPRAPKPNGEEEETQRRLAFDDQRDTLPSARLVSNTFCATALGPREPDQSKVQDVARLDRGNQASTLLGTEADTNLLLIFFGQFLDHDITLVGESHNVHADIPLANNDYFRTLDGSRRSIEFKRSATAGTDAWGHSAIPNVNTAWLSLSNMYGDTPERQNILRDKTQGRGLLKVKNFDGLDGDYLPLVDELGEDRDRFPMAGSSRCPVGNGGAPACTAEQPGKFACGDLRCNEHMYLLMFTTVWYRNHNRIAKELYEADVAAGVEPIHTDDYYFFNAKMRNTWQWQRIVMEEWLPLIIGQRNVRRLIGNYTGPKADADPTMSLVFSTAAFRFGHSGLTNAVPLGGPDGGNFRLRLLSDLFFDPSELTRGPSPTIATLDAAMNGLRFREHEALDIKIANSLRQELFKNAGPPRDLAALNIQRGRDHGLGGINSYRARYGLKPYERYRDMLDACHNLENARNIANALRRLYGYDANADAVERVDIFVSGLLECPMEGSQLGETFTHIIAEQFKNIRDADDFWWEGPRNKDTKLLNVDNSCFQCQFEDTNPSNPNTFTTMAQIFAANSDWAIPVAHAPHAFLRTKRSDLSPAGMDEASLAALKEEEERFSKEWVEEEWVFDDEDEASFTKPAIEASHQGSPIHSLGPTHLCHHHSS